MTKLTACVLIMLCFFSITPTALAEGYALYEYSARGVALGGATIARKPDPSAIAYNPSLIARLPGTHIQAGSSTITPAGKMTGHDRSGKDFSVSVKNSTWVVPHFYYTQQLNDKFTFGVGEFSRFGLGFEYPHDWAGRFNIYQVNLQTVSVTPTIAVAASESVSLGFGVEVMYATLDLKKRTDPSGKGLMEIDSSITDASDYGFGFNFSGHYKFSNEWAAGLVYRSPIRLKNRGDITYSLKKGNGNLYAEKVFNDNFKDGKAQGDVTLPMSAAAGLAWTPTQELSFEAGAVWTQWSSFDNLDISIPAPLHMAKSPKNWSDAWRVNFGAEYNLFDWLCLRAGYVYDRSPMTDEYADYLVPTKHRHIVSTGLGLTHEEWTFDFAYAYIYANSRSYKQDDTNGTYVVDSRTKQTKTDIFSASIGYHF